MSTPFPHPLILGHRGAPREATENTLRSLARAVELGADGVELDVQLSRDGVPVVIHDDSLDRTTSARGRISSLDWGAIARLTGATVPSFEQVAAWGAAAGAWLNVEIKAPGAEEEVIPLIRATGIAGKVVLSSFDEATVRRAGELDSGILRFLLTERWDDETEAALARSGAGGVCLRLDSATDAALDEIRELQLPVIVWTVNSEVQVRRLLQSGVAGVISDDAGMAARVRGKRSTNSC